jgi:hypothetical protein
VSCFSFYLLCFFFYKSGEQEGGTDSAAVYGGEDEYGANNVHTFVNAKVIPVETVLGIRGGGYR